MSPSTSRAGVDGEVSDGGRGYRENQRNSHGHAALFSGDARESRSLRPAIAGATQRGQRRKIGPSSTSSMESAVSYHTNLNSGKGAKLEQRACGRSGWKLDDSPTYRPFIHQLQSSFLPPRIASRLSHRVAAGRQNKIYLFFKCLQTPCTWPATSRLKCS